MLLCAVAIGGVLVGLVIGYELGIRGWPFAEWD